MNRSIEGKALGWVKYKEISPGIYHIQGVPENRYMLTISHPGAGCTLFRVYLELFEIKNSNSTTSYTFLLFWLHSILGHPVIGMVGGGST